MIDFTDSLNVRRGLPENPYDLTENYYTIIPAQAGILRRFSANDVFSNACAVLTWIPAFAGMTAWFSFKKNRCRQKSINSTRGYR